MTTRPRPGRTARSLTHRLTFHPLDAGRWPDIERLFGERGACAGCWCMAWRLSRTQWERQRGKQNRQALADLVAANEPLGVIAYADGEPVGWCAIAPRDAYPTLERSRTLRRVDDTPVWSVTCFFIARHARRQGVSGALLRAAIGYAAANGATVVEGYPVDPGKQWPDAFAWTGLVQVFREAGFAEVERRSPGRPIMRLGVSSRPAARRQRQR
jgi:GNAT superfamily N-acetyltransferase